MKIQSGTRRQRLLAGVLFLVGAVIGVGGALEFRYFDADTPQFWAGMAAVPAGAFTIAAATQLWRRGSGAGNIVWNASVALLAATIVGGGLDVMGPMAIIVGGGGSVLGLGWAWGARPA